jgi:hypothetical protein
LRRHRSGLAAFRLALCVRDIRMTMTKARNDGIPTTFGGSVLAIGARRPYADLSSPLGSAARKAIWSGNVALRADHGRGRRSPRQQNFSVGIFGAGAIASSCLQLRDECLHLRDKRTQRGHRVSVAIDPSRRFTPRLRCSAAVEAMKIFARGEKQSWSTATGCRTFGILR